MSMGAKAAASGVLFVRGKDASIISVVVAMTVIHFSSKCAVEKSGRVAGVTSSFSMGSVPHSATLVFLFSCTGPCRLEQHSLWCRGNTPCSLPLGTYLNYAVISARESKKTSGRMHAMLSVFVLYRTRLQLLIIYSPIAHAVTIVTHTSTT